MAHDPAVNSTDYSPAQPPAELAMPPIPPPVQQPSHEDVDSSNTTPLRAAMGSALRILVVSCVAVSLLMIAIFALAPPIPDEVGTSRPDVEVAALPPTDGAETPAIAEADFDHATSKQDVAPLAAAPSPVLSANTELPESSGDSPQPQDIVASDVAPQSPAAPEDQPTSTESSDDDIADALAAVAESSDQGAADHTGSNFVQANEINDELATETASRSQSPKPSSADTAGSVEVLAAATSAEELVRQSLQAAVTGDLERKDKLLAVALRTSPEYAPANWQAGRVQVDGEWRSVAEAQAIAAADENLIQYRKLRDEAGDDPKRQLALAAWCNRNDYSDLAKLHYRQLYANPAGDEKTRQEALRKLELTRYQGQLLTDEEIKEYRATEKRIELALVHWRPRLAKWHQALAGENKNRHDFATEQMEQVDDPQVIPAARACATVQGERFGQQLVLLLGRLGEYEATETLVHFAVLNPNASVRQAAIDQLSQRPRHDYLPIMLGALVSPIKSQWRIATDARGNVLFQHVLYQDGPEQNRALATEAITYSRDRVEADDVDVDPKSGNLPHARRRRVGTRVARDNEDTETQQANAMRQAKRRDEELALQNMRIAQANERIFEALEELTSASVQRNPNDWWFWWQSYNQSVKPKPTQFLYRQAQSSYQRGTVAMYVQRHSCFVAGTKVWTETGIMPIEDVKAGDRVLSQDVNTGELSFKLVQRTTVGGATSPMMKLTVNGEDIYPTLGHVVWVAGKGWRIAKRLEKDDQLHGVAQALHVEEMQELPAPLRVFNLVVEDSHTYFVGETGLLVHDITFRQPTRALIPGLVID